MVNEKEIVPYIRLMLNIQHPPLDECWLEGYESGGSYVEENDNPYPGPSTEHQYWLEGWWEGFYKSDEEPTTTDVKRNAQSANTKSTTAANQKRPSLGKSHQQAIHRWGKLMRYVKLSGVIAATFLISYQLIDVIR